MNGRTQQVLEYIRKYRREKGISPTYREIGLACYITSTSGVRYHLDELERNGYITRHPGVPRGIVLNDDLVIAVR